MNNLFTKGWNALCVLFPRVAVHIQYRHIMGRRLNLKDPKDLNEKINYLKFHADLDEWARLADKYAVREYVKERGLSDILVPLYGHYNSARELVEDWSNLPNCFVLKSNHACNTVRIIRDKNCIDLNALEKETDSWFKIRHGLGTNEPHYLRIKPCLIVEKLLEDPDGAKYSSSLIDYKVWCFNGKPYSFFIGANRVIDGERSNVQYDEYDLNWNRIDRAMSGTHGLPPLLPKPKNIDRLLECATILSKGHKQVRVDLYDIDGVIYFGEMTMSSQGGYMEFYSQDYLLELGNQFEVK